MMRLLTITLITLLFFSCSKEEPTSMTDPIDMEPVVEVLLLKEVRLNDLLYSSYTYNTDSTVLQSIDYSNVNGLPRFIKDYTYEGNSIETKVTYSNTGELNSTIKITEVNDTELLEEFFDNQGELVIFNTYTIGDDCGFSNILSADSFGNLLPSTRVEYIDENCSAIHYSQYGDDPEYIRWEYTRNDKFDPFNITKHPLLRVEGQKMVTKLVRKTQAGSISTNLSYDTEIEYNEFDFPIKDTRTYGDGDISMFTYEYY